MTTIAVIVVVDRLIAFAAAVLTNEGVPVRTVLLVRVRLSGTSGRFGPEPFAWLLGSGVFASGFTLVRI